MAQYAYNEPNPERLPPDQQFIDGLDALDAHLASVPHCGPNPNPNPDFNPLFNYNDCRESIQQDLITLFDGFGLRHDIPNSVGETFLTLACQIVVDNFNKVSHNCKL